MTKIRNIQRNGTPRAKVLGLPGFIWREMPVTVQTKALARTMSFINGIVRNQGQSAAFRVEDRGRRSFTSHAVSMAFEADAHNVTMKTDDDKIWIEYKGVKWFETEAAYLRSGVPADMMEQPAPADFRPVVAKFLSDERPAETMLDTVVSVDVSFILHEAPAERLAHGHIHGWADSFDTVKQLAEGLRFAKFEQAADIVPALEIEVCAGRPYTEDTLTLWFPAKNDDTTEGYGVTVSTEPHDAAIARKRAALRLEAMRRSQAGERVTVAELVSGPMFRPGLDPTFTLLANAPALPEPGWRHVAHFEHGHGGGLRPITGGNPVRDVVHAKAQDLSGQQPAETFRVYRLEIPNALDPAATVPGYVYVHDGSGRVIVSDHPVTLEAVYQAGRLTAFGPNSEHKPAPEALPLDDMPPADPAKAGHANCRNTLPPEVVNAKAREITAAMGRAVEGTIGGGPASLHLHLTMTPLDLKPVAAFYEVVRGFVEGEKTLSHLENALGEFEAAISGDESK